MVAVQNDNGRLLNGSERNYFNQLMGRLRTSMSNGLGIIWGFGGTQAKPHYATASAYSIFGVGNPESGSYYKDASQLTLLDFQTLKRTLFTQQLYHYAKDFIEGIVPGIIPAALWQACDFWVSQDNKLKSAILYGDTYTALNALQVFQNKFNGGATYAELDYMLNNLLRDAYDAQSNPLQWFVQTEWTPFITPESAEADISLLAFQNAANWENDNGQGPAKDGGERPGAREKLIESMSQERPSYYFNEPEFSPRAVPGFTTISADLADDLSIREWPSSSHLLVNHVSVAGSDSLAIDRNLRGPVSNEATASIFQQVDLMQQNMIFCGQTAPTDFESLVRPTEDDKHHSLMSVAQI